MIELLISFTIFTTYILVVYKKFGILKSVSDSYYHIKRKAVFTLVLWSFAIPVSIAASSPIMFFAVAGICFVGAAPAFKGWETESRVHVVGATSGIVLGLVSLWVELGLWYLPCIYAAGFLAIVLLKVKHRTWWIEIMAFYVILIGILIDKL
jgi:hypothetical protein